MSKKLKIKSAAELKKIEKVCLPAVFVDTVKASFEPKNIFINNVFLKQTFAIFGGDFVACKQVHLYEKSIVDDQIVQYGIYEISSISKKSRFVKVKFSVGLKSSEAYFIQHFLISHSGLSMQEIEKIDLVRFDQVLVNRLNRFEYVRNFQVDNLFIDFLLEDNSNNDDLTFSFFGDMVIHESIDKLLNMMI
jgi:hypothetical protein